MFLDGNGNAPLPRRSRADGDGSAKGESTEVDDVEHILEVSDQTPSGDDEMHPRASDTELDLAAERASVLDLLSAMFGDTNTDWGGAESIDSDVDVEMASIPRTSSGPLEPPTLRSSPLPTSPALPRAKKRKLSLSVKRRLHQCPQQPVPLSRLHKTSSRICSHLGKKRVSC
jgi:hypothetical protein